MSKTRDTGYLNNIIQYSSTGVSFVSGSTTLLSVSSSGALTTTGTITAQTLVVQTVTSSVSAITGSTKFGQLSSNTHQFTGSLYVTGALYVATGSVGIGTTNPSTKLHVASYASSGTGYFSSQGIPSLGFANSSSVALFTNGDPNYGLLFGVQNTGNGWIQQQRVDGTGTAYNILLQPSGGYVGIGTSSPGSLLSLEKAKAGSGVESLDTLSIRITGTTAIGDALNVKFLNGTNVNIATISALLGADNVAYGTLTFSTRNYNTDSLIEVMRITNRGVMEIRSGGTTVGEIKPSGADSDMTINGSRGQIAYQINGTELYGMDSAQFYPAPDNTQKLGTSGNRWTTVYATTGTINTSDINEKEQIEELSQAEKSVAIKIKGLIKKFKFKDAVVEKEDDARIHVGVIAQEVEQAFIEEGLDASKYGLFCSDTFWQLDGVNIAKYKEGAIEVTRLGIRYEQLLAFIISAL